MSNSSEKSFSSERVQTALILHPEIHIKDKARENRRSLDSKVQEIIGLTKAIHLEVLETMVLNISQIQAGAFFGKGQRENVAQWVEEHEPDIVIVNHTLSPVQQRNLEKAFKAKVIDRTGLILEIFGERAQTKEGRLQVELAALEYQRSRLVRSWTHLERQRGGAGFMGGPGETQIEIDRRLIGQRITKLKKELENVRRTRRLGRKAREHVPFPVVALVGYTNAGKSTLFNLLTESKVFAQDLLFATLDPTLRKLKLPDGQTVILSDTVGFISQLPTHLIAAFRATLEETLDADIILHVCDVSSPDHEAQHADVVDILESLEIEYETDPRIIEIYNKIDLLDEEERQEITRKCTHNDNRFAISAQTGQGIETLLQAIAKTISASNQISTFHIPYADGHALAWLHERAEMLERTEDEKGTLCRVRISPENKSRFNEKHPYYEVLPQNQRAV